MLHITDGESVAGTLRESAIPGTVSTYGDLMYEGPAPAGLNAEEWRNTRAQFLAAAGHATLEETQRYIKACEDTLAAFPQHEEVVIWLDHRLSDQLILIKVLDWFSRQKMGSVKLSLICTDRYPGMDHFVGLGQLTANQLESLLDTRRPVKASQYRKAQAAWKAFTAPKPTTLERFIQTDTSPLPFVATALRRHLQQFPSVDSGLSRTERQALEVLRERGPLSGAHLFVAVQRQEEAVFMGDTSFYRIIEDLSKVAHPLVHITGNLEKVTITQTGLDVLEGRADHVELNGIDQWRGGVHLTGNKADWRWDRFAGKIVSF
jgi:hypothetical protein